MKLKWFISLVPLKDGTPAWKEWYLSNEKGREGYNHRKALISPSFALELSPESSTDIGSWSATDYERPMLHYTEDDVREFDWNIFEDDELEVIDGDTAVSSVRDLKKFIENKIKENDYPISYPGKYGW